MESAAGTFKYFPVNDAQRAWGLYATCAGRSVSLPGAEFPSRAHPDGYFFSWNVGRILREWQMILVTHGGGTVEFKGRRFAARENSLMVLHPGCWHRYRPHAKTGWTTLCIGFGGDLADRLVGGAGFNADGEVRPMPPESRFRRLFAATVDGMLERGPDDAWSTAAAIPPLIANLMEMARPKAPDSRADIVYRAQSFITEHASEWVDFEALARKLGVSYRTFRHNFSKVAGISPLQYQLGVRLASAKNMLVSSDMPVSKIAASLGFSSPWYFSHFFAKATGMPPAVYRKRSAIRVSRV